jgi:hypothetical protein
MMNEILPCNFTFVVANFHIHDGGEEQFYVTQSNRSSFSRFLIACCLQGAPVLQHSDRMSASLTNWVSVLTAGRVSRDRSVVLRTTMALTLIPHLAVLQH